MIHTTPNSGKFRRLVHYLRPRLSSSSIAAETMAVGLLERVYHVAATETTGGEVGLLDDVVFAEMVGWLNEPGWLIAALLEADILTDDPACRYRVTDWDSIRRLYPPDIPIRRLDVTDAYWRRLRAAVISEEGTVCKYCGKDCQDDPTVDHVTPLARGGLSVRENLVVACRPCNSRKGAN